MLLGYAIVIRALLSWVPQLSDNPIVRILDEVTEPLLRPFRRFQIQGGGFGIDISPLIAYFALYIIRAYVLPLIFSLISRVTV
ncbi:YggT family protein [Desulfitobacterium sp. Sab5]|uniref:YggT family protein n=1 Tax=Desulfitobacterium TaxID=36853 RepID=UPI003CF7B43B